MPPEWFEEWFGEEYVQLYPHRDESEAERAVALIARATGLEPGWRVLDLACGAGRHARAFRAVGARCIGLDLSMTLLRRARSVTGAPLIRADMRKIPVRSRSMDRLQVPFVCDTADDLDVGIQAATVDRQIDIYRILVG